MRLFSRFIWATSLAIVMGGCAGPRMSGGGKVGPLSKMPVVEDFGTSLAPDQEKRPSPSPSAPPPNCPSSDHTSWKLSDGMELQGQISPWDKGAQTRILAVTLSGGTGTSKLEASLTEGAWQDMKAPKKGHFTLTSAQLNGQACIRLRVHVGKQIIQLSPWAVVFPTGS